MRKPASESATVLRASPNFALALTYDGRAYVAQDSEPYIQYWLTDRYRTLLSLFQSKQGATEAAAVDSFFRLTMAPRSEAAVRDLRRSIADMTSSGVLVAAGGELSRYDAKIVAAYLEHRPFPRDIAERIVTDGSIGSSTSVLDLAGGPGDLALQLAGASQDVSLMDLSRGFLAAARRRARQQRRVVTTLHDSCNRLVQRDESFDVITVAQALHWLDDVTICRGVCRALNAGGSFFVVHGAMRVEPVHPLAHLFGVDSILGKKVERPFADEAASLLRRLSLLFEALDTPDVERVDAAQGRRVGDGSERIVPARATLFRQRRPLGEGFARAFLTPRHIERVGVPAAEFWGDVKARCAAATSSELEGTCDWALLQFRRTRDRPTLANAFEVEDIVYEGRPGD